MIGDATHLPHHGSAVTRYHVNFHGGKLSNFVRVGDGYATTRCQLMSIINEQLIINNIDIIDDINDINKA